MAIDAKAIGRSRPSGVVAAAAARLAPTSVSALRRPPLKRVASGLSVAPVAGAGSFPSVAIVNPGLLGKSSTLAALATSSSMTSTWRIAVAVRRSHQNRRKAIAAIAEATGRAAGAATHTMSAIASRIRNTSSGRMRNRRSHVTTTGGTRGRSGPARSPGVIAPAGRVRGGAALTSLALMRRSSVRGSPGPGERQLARQPSSRTERASYRRRQWRRCQHTVADLMTDRGAAGEDPVVYRSHDGKGLFRIGTLQPGKMAGLPDPRNLHRELGVTDTLLRFEHVADLAPRGVHQVFLPRLNDLRAEAGGEAVSRIQVEPMDPVVARDDRGAGPRPQQPRRQSVPSSVQRRRNQRIVLGGHGGAEAGAGVSRGQRGRRVVSARLTSAASGAETVAGTGWSQFS